ncbi:glycoside hydrolase family 15 protein [Candidatus Dojkabacteria bacterium]|nr:glycoside hydrolase family 15 protein [Candidatus Dojkabacteria bacterium]
MTTSLVIGNGNLLINIDDNLQVNDFYFPHVGQENHLSQQINKMFFRINGKYCFINHNEWDIKVGYSTDSLVAESIITNKEFNLTIHFTDYVVPHENIYLREILLTNNSERELEVYIYFQNNFAIYESEIGDTAVWYHPAKSVVHYKKDRYIALGSIDKIYQFTCASKSDNHGRGAYPDLDTGQLDYNPICNGSVSSCISFKFNIGSKLSVKTNYYHVVATNFNNIQELTNKYCNVIDDQSSFLVTKYWRNWINTKTSKYFNSEDLIEKVGNIDLANDIEALYKRSLLTIRTQIDNSGAIVAANDGRYLKENGKDTYSYLWPRDGAYISLALIECGFKELTDKYFEYSSNLLTPEGYFLHKYYPYGESSAALGSSWHPWVDKIGNYQLPIQEDGTALMLYAMWKHYEKFADQEFLSKYWESMIFPMGNFIGNFRYTLAYEISNISEFVEGFKLKDQSEDEIDVAELAFEGTKLPRASYDLWEERKGINTYTCASVYTGLLSAAKLASAFGKGKLYETFYKYAQEVKEATISHLYNKSLNRFVCRLSCENNNSCESDNTIDSSLYGIWNLGMLPVDDEMVINTMKAVEETLTIKNSIGGVARREGDYYNRIDENIPGNPWFICTLWIAQYWIARKEIEKAIPYIKWVIEHADQTGLMAEQANPVSGHGESVKPLTWSHGEFIRTINLLLGIS